MTTEHTTPNGPTTAEIHAILTLSLQNSKALNSTHEQRAAIIMDDLSDAGLVILHKNTSPTVNIIESETGPTTCTVSFGGVIRFAGRSFTGDELGDGPTVPKAAYDEAADEVVAKTQRIAELEREIAGLQGQVATLNDACQRKNSDLTRYADERGRAVEAARAAEEETRDLRTRWAAYATALAALEQRPLPQVIGTNIILRHADYLALERKRDDLADSWVTNADYEAVATELQQLRADSAGAYEKNTSLVADLNNEHAAHEKTRTELDHMTKLARRWQGLAAVIELMKDSNDAELVIDGIRITPADGARTRTTNTTTTNEENTP